MWFPWKSKKLKLNFIKLILIFDLKNYKLPYLSSPPELEPELESTSSCKVIIPFRVFSYIVFFFYNIIKIRLQIVDRNINRTTFFLNLLHQP